MTSHFLNNLLLSWLLDFPRRKWEDLMPSSPLLRIDTSPSKLPPPCVVIGEIGLNQYGGLSLLQFVDLVYLLSAQDLMGL